MAFRDDRVALQAKKEAIERERDAALEEIARLKSVRDEHERERLRSQVARLSDELDELHRQMAQAKTAIPLAVLVVTGVLFLLAGVGGAVAYLRPGSTPPDPMVDHDPVRTPTEIQDTSAPVDSAPAPPKQEPVPSSHQTTITSETRIEVNRSSRTTISGGSECQATGGFGSGTPLVVSCDGEEVYREDEGTATQADGVQVSVSDGRIRVESALDGTRIEIDVEH
ncbi:MAG: hypothetical protein AAGF12_42605 [Myxococcota bacterium]